MHDVKYHRFLNFPVITIHQPNTPKSVVQMCFPFGSIDDLKGKSGITYLGSLAWGVAANCLLAEQMPEMMCVEAHTTVASVRTSLCLEGPSHHISGMMGCLARLIANPGFRGFDQEKSYLMDCFMESGDSDEHTLAYEIFMESIGETHAPVTGLYDEVDALTEEEVIKFFRDRLRSFAPVLVIYSNESHGVMMDRVKLNFHGMRFKHEFGAPQIKLFDESVFLTTAKLVVVPDDDSQTYVKFSFAMAIEDRRQTLARSILSNILGQGPVSRLAVALGETVTDIKVDPHALDISRGAFIVAFRCERDTLVESVQKTLRELHRIMFDEISAVEILRSRESERYVFDLVSSCPQSSDDLINFFTLQAFYADNLDPWDYRHMIRDLPLSEIQNCAARLFAQSGFCCELIGEVPQADVDQIAMVLYEYGAKFSPTLKNQGKEVLLS